MLAESEFVERVMARLNAMNTQLSDHEKGLLSTDAGRMFRAGYSLDDAVGVLRCTEEVNPDIPEDIALRRMHAITSKYPSTSGYI